MNADTSIVVLPVAAGSPLIDRTANTVLVTLDREEALDLIGKMATALASFDHINVLIENPTLFPKVA